MLPPCLWLAERAQWKVRKLSSAGNSNLVCSFLSERLAEILVSIFMIEDWKPSEETWQQMMFRDVREQMTDDVRHLKPEHKHLHSSGENPQTASQSEETKVFQLTNLEKHNVTFSSHDAQCLRRNGCSFLFFVRASFKFTRTAAFRFSQGQGQIFVSCPVCLWWRSRYSKPFSKHSHP